VDERVVRLLLLLLEVYVFYCLVLDWLPGHLVVFGLLLTAGAAYVVRGEVLGELGLGHEITIRQVKLHQPLLQIISQIMRRRPNHIIHL